METVASETPPTLTWEKRDLCACVCGFHATSQYRFRCLDLSYVSYCLYVLREVVTESMIKGFTAELLRALIEHFTEF